MQIILNYVNYISAHYELPTKAEPAACRLRPATYRGRPTVGWYVTTTSGTVCCRRRLRLNNAIVSW